LRISSSPCNNAFGPDGVHPVPNNKSTASVIENDANDGRFEFVCIEARGNTRI
jgi:hypothetical protein